MRNNETTYTHIRAHKPLENPERATAKGTTQEKLAKLNTRGKQVYGMS